MAEYTYQLFPPPYDKLVVLRSDGASIPFDEQNCDYRLYLEWLAAGNVPGNFPLVMNAPTIAKTTLVKRLDAAHKLTAFVSKRDSASVLFRELWHAKERIETNDATLRDVLNQIGLNPDDILTPET